MLLFFLEVEMIEGEKGIKEKISATTSLILKLKLIFFFTVILCIY
jgi:hypothetical protein